MLITIISGLCVLSGIFVLVYSVLQIADNDIKLSNIERLGFKTCAVIMFFYIPLMFFLFLYSIIVK